MPHDGVPPGAGPACVATRSPPQAPRSGDVGLGAAPPFRRGRGRPFAERRSAARGRGGRSGTGPLRRHRGSFPGLGRKRAGTARAFPSHHPPVGALLAPSEPSPVSLTSVKTGWSPLRGRGAPGRSRGVCPVSIGWGFGALPPSAGRNVNTGGLALRAGAPHLPRGRGPAAGPPTRERRARSVPAARSAAERRGAGPRPALRGSGPSRFRRTDGPPGPAWRTVPGTVRGESSTGAGPGGPGRPPGPAAPRAAPAGDHGRDDGPGGRRLDRLTHHVHILEMNGESYRLQASRRRRSGLPAEATTGATPV